MRDQPVVRSLKAGRAVVIGRDNRGTINLGPVTTIQGGPEVQRDWRNKRLLLRKVQTFWIDGVLERSGLGAARLDFGKTSQPDAVVHPWDSAVADVAGTVQPLPPGTSMLDLFEQMDRALLILGAPGAGKT